MPNLLDYFKKIIQEYQTARQQEDFTGHELGDIFRQELPSLLGEYLRDNPDFAQDNYQIKGSIGMGHWAKVPWLAVLDKEITTTTQEGVYVVYLFSEDMERLYLTLNQGVTNTSAQEREEVKNEARNQLDLSQLTTTDDVELATSGTGQKYEDSTIGYILYRAQDLLTDSYSEEKLKSDLYLLLDKYQDFKQQIYQSHQQTDRELIFRKQVDKSIFKYGFTIPQKHHQHFLSRIELDRGESTLINLFIQGKQYQASLRNVDRDTSSLTLQIRYDSNHELRQLLQKSFPDTYSKVAADQEPDETIEESAEDYEGVYGAEYIEIYSTSQPDSYELKLSPFGKHQDPELVRENGNKYISARNMNTSAMINHLKSFIQSRGFYYPDGMIENFYLSLKTKPFVLLAGISGTGKTRLVKLFAEALNCTPDNKRFQLISVRPDWNDSSDLLGYQNIKDEFLPGPMIKIIKHAKENPEDIHLVCLDEMNLARVEYYFSEFLSKMETRSWQNDRPRTTCLFTEDDFASDKDVEEYAGLRIPANLFIVGTVNMDETTHPFSKKVLDRANTIEFSRVKLSQYQLSQDSPTPKPLTEVKLDFLLPEYLSLNDCSREHKEEIDRVIAELEKVNQILNQSSLHVGYRVRDEVIFYLLYNQRHSLLVWEDAFDFQLMQKILPRIQGSSAAIKQVLKDLFQLAAPDYSFAEDINVGEDALNYARSEEPQTAGGVLLYPRSAEKIAYMLKKMEENRFTSYWL